jgi:hypothetical protein
MVIYILTKKIYDKLKNLTLTIWIIIHGLSFETTLTNFIVGVKMGG